MLSRSMLGGLLALWVGAVAGGSALQWNYVNAPGAREAQPERWPEASLVKRESTGLTLVMLAHPRCPCTRASLRELASLMEQTKGRLSAHVFLWVPKSAHSDFHDGELWRRARGIPGVQVHADVEGEEARRFGALTSGHTVVYGPDGRLLFSGGLTPMRGHSGESAGKEAILALARDEKPERARTDVYGCGLRESSARASAL
ncbi:RedB protein [Melittangium boletus]|uniref:RedB protein n=1 Tax=Melittangium boletus DSM 14713 TaxID=1294270 RepID=A0A250IBK4_9BACT|nr:RedB protein [Melittangium boletus]ATB28613.1 hypothetical protein MEBOL_002062 [Melittangium boletus DSM 14713]